MTTGMSATEKEDIQVLQFPAAIAVEYSDDFSYVGTCKLQGPVCRHIQELQGPATVAVEYSDDYRHVGTCKGRHTGVTEPSHCSCGVQ